MTCALLIETRKIKKLFWPGPTDEATIVTGMNGVVNIRIVSVNGEMAEVPWVRVDMEDGSFAKYNAAHLEGIEYEAEAP